MTSPGPRFKHTCRNCTRRTSPKHSRECHECALRDTYTTEDVYACEFCSYPTDVSGYCIECAVRVFDEKATYLDSLTVCGIGNTDGPWQNRTWRELGGAVAGVKNNEPYLYEPLRRLFLYRLQEFLRSAPCKFDLITHVPTSKRLLPMLLADTARHKDNLGLTGTFDGAVLVKTTQESHGSDRILAPERWQLYHDLNLYEVAKPELVEWSSILLIDDIYKSGCSMNMCAKKMFERGAEHVHGFALCRWPKRGIRPTLRVPQGF